ncbi:aquaporin AQPAe.a-like [Trichogramma pretiosum]|uniref:aquaporin AQPAe.a-like n=1 Tax=Trichogramma pretiosum TaxID=7493 RepID=UPI0006C9B7B0|nr:aquaporin AQPAe.a-like [Trichogramma pretiosum]
MSAIQKVDPWKMQEGTFTMFVAEIIATASLLFLGCMGGIGIWGSSPPPPLQTAMTFGMAVNLLIMTYGHLSGAHMNPAVTLGAVMIGLKSAPTGLIYVLAQFIGATIGYGLIKIVTPVHLMSDGNPASTAPLCVTVIHPEITIVQGILIEILCTSLILIGACATWDPRCAHTTDSVAIRFGMAVVSISLAAAPYTGCSMNPARTFAPALWNGAWKDQWVYWVGPMAGGALGTSAYQVLFAIKEDDADKTRDEDYESVKMSEIATNTPDI